MGDGAELSQHLSLQRNLKNLKGDTKKRHLENPMISRDTENTGIYMYMHMVKSAQMYDKEDLFHSQ